MKKKIKISEEQKKLEDEFEALVNDTNKRIKEKINVAASALREAIAISEETGVPFNSGVSFLRNTYYPSSFDKLHNNLDPDFVADIAAWRSDDCWGWQHSAVC